MSTGSHLGVKSKAVLNYLRTNGRTNRLDLELSISSGPLEGTIQKLRSYGFITRTKTDVDSGCYLITRLGRAVLGEALAIPAPREPRICNASTTGNYLPGVHNTFQDVRRL
jgi:DNA-binding PadR family transcriptional regulator